MRSLSEATARIASKNFSKKFVSIGRIVNQWEEIIGKQYAQIAIPAKLHYRKNPKTKKQTATLEIATSSANATIMSYQKGLILERINTLFGDDWITDIKFTPSESMIDQTDFIKKTNSPLTPSQKNYLSEVLESIEDPEIKEKLENFGKAFLTDKKK